MAGGRRRVRAGAERGRAAAPAGDRGRHRAPARGQRPAHPPAGDPGSEEQDPVRDPEGDGEDAAGVLPARAAEGDPPRAGRGRPAAGRGGGAAPAGGGRGDAGRGAGAGDARAGPAAPDPARVARGGDRAHLRGLAGGPPLEQGRQRAARSTRGGEDPQRGPLRAGEGQGPHRGVPGRAPPLGEAAQPHPVLRRAARGGQDLPGALHRPRHGAPLRARLPRWRAGRGGDPGPPAHLRGGHAGAHPARDARRRGA